MQRLRALGERAPTAFRGVLVLVAWAVVTAALQACGGGGDGEVRTGVVTESLAAFRRLTSYEVQASGKLWQGSTTAQFELTYEFVAPDRLRFVSESTSAGRSDRAGIILIGDRSWDFADGSWVEQPALSMDVSVFSAERMWNLVPFGRAKQTGSENVNGTEARHVRHEAPAELEFEPLAGALLAGTEPAFHGDLTRLTIDYWTDASTGWPVRIELLAEGNDRGVELTGSLTRANDPSISVEAP